jgi:hypothetical protein
LKDLKIVGDLFDLSATINVGLEHIIVHLRNPPPFGRADACYVETDNTVKMLNGSPVAIAFYSIIFGREEWGGDLHFVR